jgi:hypothetical protein
MTSNEVEENRYHDAPEVSDSDHADHHADHHDHADRRDSEFDGSTGVSDGTNAAEFKDGDEFGTGAPTILPVDGEIEGAPTAGPGATDQAFDDRTSTDRTSVDATAADPTSTDAVSTGSTSPDSGTVVPAGGVTDSSTGTASSTESTTAVTPGSDAADSWRELQGRFVDDPEAVVREAGTLVEQDFATLRSRLESGDTENLRTAFRRYRDLHSSLI